MAPTPSTLREHLQGDGIAAGRHALTASCRPGVAPAAHPYAALTYVTGGRSLVEQRGRWALGRGDVLLVPPGEPHRTLEAAGAECWGVGFSPARRDGDAEALLAPFERVRDGGAAVVHIPEARRGFFEGLLGELGASSPARSPMARRSLLALVVDEVARAARDDDRPRAAPAVVAESLRFIERHCLGPLTLRAVADAVGRTPSHVTSALTRATGRSAVAWIVAHRLAEARRLLAGSDVAVEEVAARVGYADATHFIRMFRREHGATPAAWRAARRASGEGA